MASWRIRFHDKWPHLASLYASTHNLDEDGKHPDPMMGQDNVFDPSEPYGAYRYYVQPSTRSEFSIEEPGYMSRPVYKDEESRSSDYTSGDSFRRGTTCRVLLCVFLVVSFIGVVVAAITLAVLLSRTTTPLPEKPAHTEIFESEASIFNREFNDQLLDNSTDEFKLLEEEFCKAIEQMFTDSDSPVKNAFGGCEVLEFINGSVQVRYRLKLFSENPERFKLDERILQKLEDHFAKKVNQIGPWQNLKFNPQFVRKFVRIEPITTPVPTTKTTETTKPTTKRISPIVKTTRTTVTTTKSTTEQMTPEIKTTQTQTPEIVSAEISPEATTAQAVITTEVEQTTAPTEVKTTTVIPPVVTEKGSTVQITTQKGEEILNQTTPSDLVIDVTTQKQQTESEITTVSKTTVTETVAETTNVSFKADNMTTGTTAIPLEETTTDIFDYFYDYNDTFVPDMTTEYDTTNMTDEATSASLVTDSPATLPDFSTQVKVGKETLSTELPVKETTSGAVTEISSEEPTLTQTVSQQTSQTHALTSIDETTAPSQTSKAVEITQTTQEIPVTQTDIAPVTSTVEDITESVVVPTTTIGQLSSLNTTETIVNITDKIPSAVVESTEASSTLSLEEVLSTEVVTSKEDIQVKNATTQEIETSTAKTETEIVTELSTATLPPAVTAVQEQTTSSEATEQTTTTTTTTEIANITTTASEAAVTEIVSTQPPTDAFKISVNETTDKPLVTELVDLNVTALPGDTKDSTKTTKSKPIVSTESTVVTEIHTSSDSLNITTEIVKEENLTTTDSGIVHTSGKVDTQTTQESSTFVATTEAIAIEVTNLTSASTSVTRTETQPATTTVPSPATTTVVSSSETSIDVTERIPDVKNVTESLASVSDNVLLNGTEAYDDYNASDIYYDFYETTTSGDLFVDSSTELPTEEITASETKTSIPQETSTLPVSGTTEEIAMTTETLKGTTKPSTEAVKSTTVTDEQTAATLLNDTAILSEGEFTTALGTQSTLRPEVTTQSQDLPTATLPESQTTEIPSVASTNVTVHSTDLTTVSNTTGTTEEIQIIATSSEIPVIAVDETTVPTLNETFTDSTGKTSVQSSATEVAPTEKLTTDLASNDSIAIDRAPTANDTTEILSAENVTAKVVSEIVKTELESTGSPTATAPSVTETHTATSFAESSSTQSSNDTEMPQTDASLTTKKAKENITEGTTTIPTGMESDLSTSDTSTFTTQQMRNETVEEITEQVEGITTQSVQETTTDEIANVTIAPETVNVTVTYHAENITSAQAEVDNVTTVDIQTTSVSTKSAEAAFLDEYGEAAFIEEYIPTTVNKTEETSVISTSNITYVNKTTASLPVATTMSPNVTVNMTQSQADLNVTALPENMTESVTTLETTVVELEVTTVQYKNASNETSVTEDVSVSTKSDTGASTGLGNVTVIPETTTETSMEQNTTQSFTRETLINNTISMPESLSENITAKFATSPTSEQNETVVSETVKNVTVSFINTTESESLNKTLSNDTIELVPQNETLSNETIKLVSQNLTLSNDTTESVLVKETFSNDTTESVPQNETVGQNTTQASFATTPSVVSETSTDDYYYNYNDTEYYYEYNNATNVTENTTVTNDPSVASTTQTIFITTEAANITTSDVAGIDPNVADSLTIMSRNTTNGTETGTETVTKSVTLVPGSVTEITTGTIESVP